MRAPIPPELREFVMERAGNRCEYCRLHQAKGTASFHVDHILPVTYFGGAASSENLAWSCPSCNRKKGPQTAGLDPITQQATALYHPRKEVWDEHFYLEGAEIMGITPVGRTTAFLLDFNEPLRVETRQTLIDAGLWQ